MAKSNVELVIRARDEASRALRGMSQALDDFTREQRRAAGEAGDTGSALDRLGAELGELDQHLDRLRHVGRLGKDLASLGKEIDRQRNKAASAARAYQEVAARMAAAEAPSRTLRREFERKAAAVEKADAQLGELQGRFSGLTRETLDAKAAIGLLGASENELTSETARAATQFTALQTELRETRRLAKGALDGALDVGAVSGLAPVQQAVTDLGQAIRAAGTLANASSVDFKGLTQQINALEATAKDLGDLRQMTQAFAQMREQAQALGQAWEKSEQQTAELAARFAETEQPSRELAEALGQSRAMTQRLEEDFKGAETRVASLGEALRAAGVDTEQLGAAQASIEAQIEAVAGVVARSRIELDRLGDAQKVQAAERKRAAAAEAEAQQQADANARRAAENLRKSREAAKAALQVHRESAAAVAEAERAFREASEEASRLGQAMAQAEQPSAALRTEFETARTRAAALKDNFHALREEAAGLGQALAGAGHLPDVEIKTTSADRLDEITAAQKRLEAATHESSRAVERFNGEQERDTLARQKRDTEELAAARRQQSAEEARAQQQADENARRQAANLREARAAAKEALQVYRQTPVALAEAERAFREASEEATRLGREMAQTEHPSAALSRAFQASRDKAGALRENLRTLRTEAAELGQALASTTGLPDSAVQTDSADRLAKITDAQKALAAATRDSTQAVEKFDNGQQAERLAQQRVEIERMAAAQRELARSSRVYEQTGEAVAEATQSHQRASQQVGRLAQAMAKAERQVADINREFRESQASTEAAEQAYRAAEQNLDRLAQAINKAATPSKKLAEEFDRAQAEVKELRAEFAASQKDTKALEGTFKAAEAASAALSEEFARAKARGADLKANAREVREAYQGLEAAMRDSADDADALATAQQTLDAALERSGKALTKTGQEAEKAERRMRTLADSADRSAQDTRELGDAADRTGRDMQGMADRVHRANTSLAAFRDQGRKTLSLLQRIRGQVLALTSAYIGLYGLGRGASNIVRTGMELEAAQARLKIAVGDNADAVEAELQFVRRVADDLKLPFEALVSGYSRFAVAARLAGTAGEEVQAVFLGLAKAGRVNKVSAEGMTRVYRAVEQIFSKSKVQAEEIRQQLGDTLSGSVEILKQAVSEARGGIELTDEAFNKLLENGQISSRAMVLFAAKIEEKFGVALPAALQSTSAKIAELQNVIYDLRLLVFQSDFIDAFGESLVSVKEALESPEAQQGARRLGEAIGNLIRMLVSLVEHANGVIVVLKLLGIALAVKWGANIAAGLAMAGASLRTFVGKTKLATGAVRGFWLMLSGVGLFLAGWSIAEWAAREFPAFGRFWAAMKSTIFQGLAEIKAQFAITWVQIKDIMSGNVKAATGQILRNLGTIADKYADFWGFFGVSSMENGFRQLGADLGGVTWGGFSEAAEEEIAKIRAALAKEKKKIDDEFFDEFQRRDAEAGGPSLLPTDIEGETYDGLMLSDVLKGELPSWADIILEGEGEANAAAKRLADQMAKELDRVQDRLAELSAETLEERLALIRREFAELLAYLKLVGNEAGVESVESLIDILQVQEEITFNAEKRREHEDGINELMQFRRDLMEQIEFLQAQGDAASLTKAEALKEQLEEVEGTLRDLIAAAIEWARAMGLDDMVAKMELIELGMRELGEEILNAAQLNKMFASGAAKAFVDVGTSLGKVIDGTHSLGDAFRSAGDAFRQFAARFLQQIAEMILQAIILKAITGSVSGGSGGIGGSIADFINGTSKHTGGLVGGAGHTRAMPAAWFANAVRYHGGGIAGLAPNEVPAILQRGEEVLTKGDPRHATNGGGANQQSIKIINTLDPAEVVSAGLSGPAGERVIENYLSRNRAKVKRIIG